MAVSSAPVAPRVGLTPPTQRGFSHRLIGDVAVSLGYATAEQVEEAVAESQATGRLTGRVLLDRRVLSPGQLSRVIAERFGLDHLNLSSFEIDRSAAKLVSVEALRRFGAIPVARTSPSTLLVAVSEPSNVLAIDDLGLLTGMAITPAIAMQEEIDNLLDELAADAGAPIRRAPDIVEVVQGMVEQAVARGATDLHLTPEGGELVGRLRVDGVLTRFTTFPGELAAGVLSRLKVLADLELTDRRKPQQGRTVVVVDGRPLDVRIVTLPLVDGEGVVVRILDRPERTVALEHLGLSEAERGILDRAGSQGHGAILVTSPRDAGKTATLHALLALHASDERSACTIEDPVERRVHNVRHMAVDTGAGVTFAGGLNFLLASDPDVVLVGELREPETAALAVTAALGSRLVLAGLHTDDAPGALTRLIEMGVAPYVLAGAVRCVLAQRLVRMLCPSCRQPVHHGPAALHAAGFAGATEPVDAFEARGCAECLSGYRGRTAICEVLEVADEVRDLILAGARTARVAQVAEAAGMRRLHDVALARLAEGATSLAELARVLPPRQAALPRSPRASD